MPGYSLYHPDSPVPFPYLEPAVGTESAFLGDSLPVCLYHNEVRVRDHLTEVGLRVLQVFLQSIQVPLETVDHVAHTHTPMKRPFG